MSDKRKRRLRLNGTHRWSNLETETLIHHVLNAIESDVSKYEQPTAQQFYTNQCADDVLKSIDWKTMRTKMRNLRNTYIKAKNWNDQVGSELFKSDKSRVEARILAICPYYNELETIFGPLLPVDPIKVNSIASNDYMSSTDMNEDSVMNTETIECDDDDDDNDFNEDSNQSIQIVYPKVEKEEASTALNLFSPLKRTASTTSSHSTQMKPKQKETEPEVCEIPNDGNKNIEEQEINSKLKYEFEGSKLAFERRKLFLDMKYHDEKTNWKRLQLNLDREKFEFEKRKISEDQRLRKYEIDKQFEIKKLEIERDERLQQLELQLKYKYKNIEEFDEKNDYI